jgi:hypothetical protein
MTTKPFNQYLYSIASSQLQKSIGEIMKQGRKEESIDVFPTCLYNDLLEKSEQRFIGEEGTKNRYGSIIEGSKSSTIKNRTKTYNINPIMIAGE